MRLLRRVLGCHLHFISQAYAMPMEPVLSVVIVNWNAGNPLRACLEAVAKSGEGLAHEVIVVDNASTDESLERAGADQSALVLRNARNFGYTTANNQGAARARGEFLLFLSPDAAPVGDALPVLVRALEDDPNLAVIAPRLINADGSVSDDMGGRFPSLRTIAGSFLLLSRIAPRWFPGMTRVGDVKRRESCDWVCGAALGMRRSVWEQVPWNEELVPFGEDLDLCSRVRDRGWDIAITPDATVAYLGDASIARQGKVDRLAGSRSGIALHLERHAGRLEKGLSLATMHLGMRLRRAAHLARYRLFGEPRHAARAHKLRIFLAQDRDAGPASGGRATEAEPSPPNR
jgi:N-acetylglucosaminyl-diphospho-decaprenol L-rhamnosyltransferase